MSYLSSIKDDKKQSAIFVYAFCASLIIHAGVFLLLAKLNERWRWIPLNDSVFEVNLVMQAGGMQKASGPGSKEPAAKSVTSPKPAVIKKPPVIKTKFSKKRLTPSEIKPADLTQNPDGEEKTATENEMSMISHSVQTDSMQTIEGSGSGSSNSREDTQGRGLGENDSNAKGSGGGFGSRMTYLNMVRSKIENQKKYPHAARERNIEGEVTVEFDIGLDGKVSEPSVYKSSGFRLLDFAAVEAVRKASPFDLPPKKFFNQSIHINLPIRFELIR